MKATSQEIVKLNNRKAKEYFLDEKNYVSFELPPYIKFNKLLKEIDLLLDKPLSDFYINDIDIRPQKIENINYKLMVNKDGKYDWRPFEIIHPLIYVDIIKNLTTKQNWKEITDRFKCFKDNSWIDCKSIPRKSNTKQSNKAENVSNWISEVEKQSIKLSVLFNYIFISDISDCYGSIYTHSISWALYGKNWCKVNIKNKDYKDSFGKLLENSFQCLHYDQTNGIPQGNVLSDLIAELVLGYIDIELTHKLKQLFKNNTEFKILRYRDDYRIFVKEISQGEIIMKILSETLAEFGMKLSKGKTCNSNNIIDLSVKRDKLEWVMLYKNKKNNILEKLVVLNNFSEKYPNSGTLKKELTKLHKKIFKCNYLKEDIYLALSYTVNIAIRNPNTYPACAALISKFVNLLNTRKEKLACIRNIKTKFGNIPNTGYLEIWLQRFSIKYNKKIKYNDVICNIVKGNKNFNMWNSNWLNKNTQEILKRESYVDDSVIDIMDEVIQPIEYELFINERSL